MSQVRIAALAAGVLVLSLAAALWWWRAPQAAGTRIAGMPEALPRATAEAEFLAPAALEGARALAQQRGDQALIVHRHGHRVFEYFASGRDGASLLDGGELATAVLTLARQEADAAGPVEAVNEARRISERLWVPLRAGDAWLVGAAGDGARRCCIRARLDDWMRVGDLLLGGGAYLGERFVAADAARALLAARAPGPWQGDEPLLARDGMAFDLDAGARLWLAPRRSLAILVWSDAQAARDTLLPNIILRGLDDPSPAIGGDIGDIVPGH